MGEKRRGERREKGGREGGKERREKGGGKERGEEVGEKGGCSLGGSGGLHVGLLRLLEPLLPVHAAQTDTAHALLLVIASTPVQEPQSSEIKELIRGTDIKLCYDDSLHFLSLHIATH